MGIFDAINIFSKGIITMATTPNNINPNSDAELNQEYEYQLSQDNIKPASTSASVDTYAQQMTQMQNMGYDTSSVAFDDQGVLLPGWELDPSGSFYVETAQSYSNRTGISSPSVVSNQSDSAVIVGGPIANSAATVTEQTLDDGSDPYVSNGQSYLPQTNAQQTVNEEDPFLAAQRQREADYNTQGPTEQQVLQASQDASISKEQQKQIEQAQANQRASLKAEEANANNPRSNWTAGSVNQTRPQQSLFVARNSIQKDDWRIRLSLAPSAKYLYKMAKTGDILYPLASTDGVIFPYTPQIQTAYRANYDPLDLVHSNYKLHFYKNSNVDDIQITADFSAQDTSEANYLLAVIHFFRSVTKMFYGQDGNNGPKAGTPPPLCYLNGYGQYQFNEHPVLVSSFTYSLPNDVDYIRSGSPTVIAGTNTDSAKPRPSTRSDIFSLSKLRAQGSRLKTNSISAEPSWKNYSNENATYVPTKMQIQLTLIPVVTRNDISKNFSLEKYATGELIKGRTRKSGGGIW